MAGEGRRLTQEQEKALVATAQRIMQQGKGLLALVDDENSAGSITQHFDAFSLENTVEMRQAYRELVFTTKGLSGSISAILISEEAFQKIQGRPVSDVTLGIQLVGDVITMNEEGAGARLSNRLADNKQKGCDFALWRCAINVEGEQSPALVEKTLAFANFASICQRNGLVPIIQPEVLSDGDHDLARCQVVTEQTLDHTFRALRDRGVLLEGTLLMLSMVSTGHSCPHYAMPDEVGQATTTAIRRCLPLANSGVIFSCSGGYSEIETVSFLNAIHQCSKLLQPSFAISFSYGPSLHAAVIEAWAGRSENVGAAQHVLLRRAKALGRAQLGVYYAEGEEKPTASTSTSRKRQIPVHPGVSVAIPTPAKQANVAISPEGRVENTDPVLAKRYAELADAAKKKHLFYFKRELTMSDKQKAFPEADPNTDLFLKVAFFVVDKHFAISHCHGGNIDFRYGQTIQITRERDGMVFDVRIKELSAERDLIVVRSEEAMLDEGYESLLQPPADGMELLIIGFSGEKDPKNLKNNVMNFEKVTSGWVRTTQERLRGKFEATCAVEQGDSGGLVINACGKIIGMCTDSVSNKNSNYSSCYILSSVHIQNSIQSFNRLKPIPNRVEMFLQLERERYEL